MRTIRSTSSRGAAEISLGFDWGTDMVVAALQTQAAVNAERTALPEGAEFEVRRMDPTVFPTLGLSLSSASLSDVEITEIARFQLSPALSTIEGVAKIEILGGRQAELEVLLDPRKLAAAGLSTTELASVLAADNTVSAVGRLEDRFRLFLVLNEARVKNAKALGETVLKVGSSGVLMLKDVAEIRLDVAPAWTAVNADGRAAVLVNVMRAIVVRRDASPPGSRLIWISIMAEFTAPSPGPRAWSGPRIRHGHLLHGRHPPGPRQHHQALPPAVCERRGHGRRNHRSHQRPCRTQRLALPPGRLQLPWGRPRGVPCQDSLQKHGARSRQS